jgi:nitrate/nitrite transporter NarK
VYAIGMMAFMAMTSVLGLYLAKDFGVTKESIGPFYSYIGIVSVVMRALLLGPVVRRVGEVGAMRLGTLALACGMLALPLPVLLPVPASARLLTVAVIATLVPVGTALLFPSTTALVSGRSPRQEMGQIMGVQQLFGGVARCLGPIWSTWLFTQSVLLPFWVAASFMLGGGVLTWRIRREVPPRPAPAGPDCATAEGGLGEAEIMSDAALVLTPAGDVARDGALGETAVPAGAGHSAAGRHSPL